MSSVRLSVRLSVMLVDQDHTGLKSWKLSERTISPTPSLFVAQRGTWGNLGETIGGVMKVACWKFPGTQSGNISETRKDRGKVSLLRRAYRNSPTLFRTVPTRTPHGLLLPNLGVRNAHPKLQSLLSQETPGKANLAGTFRRSIRTKDH